MQSINEYNKGGKITIEIGIGVEEKNELSIQATVKTTKPKGKIPKNPYYRDQKGNLYMDDPNQLKIFSTRKVVNQIATFFFSLHHYCLIDFLYQFFFCAFKITEICMNTLHPCAKLHIVSK